MKIGIDIQPVSVEIGEATFSIAPKTVEVARKLFEIVTEGNKEEKSPYLSWLEQLEVVLGAEATEVLFPKDHRDEIDLDRLEAIYQGVMEAFDYNGRALRGAREQEEMNRLKDLADTLTTITDKVTEIYGKYPGISRPVQE